MRKLRTREYGCVSCLANQGVQANGTKKGKTLQNSDFGKCRKFQLAACKILSLVQFSLTTQETGVEEQKQLAQGHTHALLLVEQELKDRPLAGFIFPVLTEFVTFSSLCNGPFCHVY